MTGSFESVIHPKQFYICCLLNFRHKINHFTVKGLQKRKDEEMKLYRKKAEAVLIALMTLSSAMMMGACENADHTVGPDSVSGTGTTYQEKTVSEDSSSDEAREYSYEDNRTTNNYTYEYNTYESSDSSGSHSPSAGDSCDEEYGAEHEDQGSDSGDSVSEEDSSSYGISETDYASGAYVSTNDFEFTALPVRIEIEEHVASVSTTSAEVNVKVYNPTGAAVEAIGCRFGDGILLISEDKVTGSFTDTEFDETFTFYPEDGEFPSGYTYTYEVYVVCNGHEYTVGTGNFRTPLY